MPTVGRIEIDPERCKGCACCVEACPRGLIRLRDRPNRQGYLPAESVLAAGNQPKRPCTGCASCGIICPEAAIAVYASRGADRPSEDGTPAGSERT